MCSLSWQRMENDQGDLADIFRASGNSGTRSMSNSSINWQIQSEPMNYPSGIEEFDDSFGDPFLNMRDPLLHHEFNMGGPEFFEGSDSTGLVKMNAEEDDGIPSRFLGEEIKEPCNIFSRMLQISPHNTNPSPTVASPRGIKPSSFEANSMIKSSNANCLVGVQIPPPRNPGIKRRKSQTKKVVCIPAPAAAANSTKPTGEVVPSDHWAWRKYGQKPIKGSPYPRGYYRCSSSKGCSARKQVERSRNDPNMLVITYTSEHNHPWPTQRNALAGSTRTQPMKKDAASKSSPSTHSPKPTSSKEEPKEMDKDNRLAVTFGGSSSIAPGSVKEEMGKIEKPMIDMAYQEFDQDFNHQSYTFVQQESDQADDFFADLGELDPDSLNAMFSQGFTAGKSEQDGGDKSMDPFSSLFDSSGGSFGEAGKGL